MKKILLLAVLLMAAFFSFGQYLKKGNLISPHVLTITLQPNATMEQFASFYQTQVIPAYEKHFAGAKGYLVTAIRGEAANHLGVLWIFESEKARDRYFNADGSLNAAGTSAMEQVKPVEEQLEKIGTSSDKYTDWVVH